MRKYKYGCQIYSTYACDCWAKSLLAFLLLPGFHMFVVVCISVGKK